MINKYLTTLTIIKSIGMMLNYYIETDCTIFRRSDLPDITRKGHNVENRSIGMLYNI